MYNWITTLIPQGCYSNQKLPHQQLLLTLSLVYHSLFLISLKCAGQLRVGMGQKKKKINDWMSGHTEFLFGSERLMVFQGDQDK